MICLLLAAPSELDSEDVTIALGALPASSSSPGLCGFARDDLNQPLGALSTAHFSPIHFLKRLRLVWKLSPKKNIMTEITALILAPSKVVAQPGIAGATKMSASSHFGVIHSTSSTVL